MLRSRIDFEGFERSDIQNLEKFTLPHFAFSKYFTVYRGAETQFNALQEDQKCLGTPVLFFFGLVWFLLFGLFVCSLRKKKNTKTKTKKWHQDKAQV